MPLLLPFMYFFFLEVTRQEDFILKVLRHVHCLPNSAQQINDSFALMSAIMWEHERRGSMT